jgi:hypothetical protein
MLQRFDCLGIKGSVVQWDGWLNVVSLVTNDQVWFRPVVR